MEPRQFSLCAAGVSFAPSDNYRKPRRVKGRSGDRMELKRDDWVATESGETGKAVHISRMTVFVAFMVPCKADRMEAFLESQLTSQDANGRRSGWSSLLGSSAGTVEPAFCV